MGRDLSVSGETRPPFGAETLRFCWGWGEGGDGFAEEEALEGDTDRGRVSP